MMREPKQRKHDDGVTYLLHKVERFATVMALPRTRTRPGFAAAPGSQAHPVASIPAARPASPAGTGPPGPPRTLRRRSGWAYPVATWPPGPAWADPVFIRIKSMDDLQT